MKKIKDLLQNLNYTILHGEANSVGNDISEVVYDSRKVCDGCLFIAISGAAFDGHDFVMDAAKNGAKCVVVEKDCDSNGVKFTETIGSDCIVVKVEDTRIALAEISAAYFDYPAKEVNVIGITGTKGKTTTTYLIRNVLEHAGIPCGLMGTIETIIGDEHIHAVNTTPESFIIQRDLRKMADAGIKYCVMEVSSQGLMLHRTAAIPFKIGVFTNISPDHIGPNEHKDFEEYLNCKSLLFKQCEYGIVNLDDKNAVNILKDATCKLGYYTIAGGKEKVKSVFNNTSATEKTHDSDVKSQINNTAAFNFAALNNCDVCLAGNINFIHEKGVLATEFDTIDNAGNAIRTRISLPGFFSVYNALCAICVCKYLGIDKEDVVAALGNSKVRGRIELVETGSDFTLIIDYAHNAMSLESILSTLRAYEPGRLVCIFGCGGNRDPKRRFTMGKASGESADFTIITSDNPRFEDPALIMEGIVEGIKETGGEYICIEDRKEALRYAIKNARPKDVILLAGKGHEDYQEIKGVKHHMDERELCREVLTEEGIL